MFQLWPDRRVRNDLQAEEGLTRATATSVQVLSRKQNTTEIVRFKAEHGRKLSTVPDNILHIYETLGEGYTALLNGEPIAAAGVMIPAPGLGGAWGLITDRARAMPVLLHKNVSRVLNNIIGRHELRRVDVIIRCNDARAVRWAQRLGFEIEGEMRQFYPDGTPAFFMARTRKVNGGR